MKERKTLMAIGGGGLIDQVIHRDEEPTLWDANNTIAFNVQIINAEVFHGLTGLHPSPSPATAKAYAKAGYPYFAMPEAPSGVYGNFVVVKSVNQIDCTGPLTGDKRRAAKEVSSDIPGRVVLIDVYGNRRGFRSVEELEHDVERFEHNEIRRLIAQMEGVSLESDAETDSGSSSDT